MFKKDRIKKIWDQISLEIKNIFLKFPCTVLVIILATLLETICMDDIDCVITAYILPFFVWSGAGIFFSESAFYKKSPLKIGSALLISILSAFLVYQYHYCDAVIAEDTWTARLRIAYVIFCIAMGIYCCYRRSGLLLPQYGIRVFSNMVKIHIIYSILSFGALSMGLIIQILFFGNDYYFDIISRMFILVIGIFYIPSIIYSFSETEKRVDTFSEILVKYVLFALTMMVFAIIYLYVLKILILRDIPSNELFAILTGLFILAMPTWTMMESMERYSLYYKVSRKFPLLFVPLILLQTYSIGARIRQYGVTPDRYLGVMWILLEIIYLVIYYRLHRYVGRMFAVVAAASVIALLVPGVNMYHVSVFSQQKILGQYKEDANFSDETKQKIYGAYKYILNHKNGETYLDEKYTAEEIEEIKGFYSEEDDRYDSSDIRIGTEERVNNLDISSYSKMRIVQYSMDYGDPLPDLKHLELCICETGEIIIIADLEEIIESYISYGLDHIGYEDNYHVDISDYYLNHCRIELDDEKGSVLYIRNFDITYDKEAGKIKYLDITGYLFQ